MTLQEQLNTLKKEYKQFENKIFELEKQLTETENLNPSKTWKPQMGEKYFVLELNGGITEYSWKDNVFDNAMYQRGNCFKTKEEAKWVDKHRILVTEFERFVAENDPRPITERDFRDLHIEKYSILYVDNDRTIRINCTNFYKKANQIYASNPTVLEKAIEHFGKERLKKYYFGVTV